MCDALFVGQELIDVFAVSLEQVLTILDSNHHGIEFIRTEPNKETGRAIEFDQQLPILAQGRNR